MPSSPVIPFDDPTILFINAGMNQFKDVFTGKRRSDYPRATSSQKCIRAGGKHNDLDNVGFTARHHTFFEMLGNFSFGDYFKEEAIKLAWEWITRDLGLPKDRLYASVYDTDDEAFALWEKIAPELKNGRILRFGKKDNYWSMGDVGPCGPCSEIHFDRGEQYGRGTDDIVNGETDRFVEIWNLVFMQYDQTPNGEVPLPKPSVDTGAGLERIAAIMQNVDTNFGIDLFAGLLAAISDITHAKYKDNIASHHVIADHIRALTFALADGAGISNEGRGYVLRRILRRAARHGRQLGTTEPFMYKLVPVLTAEMGGAFPEIVEKQDHVANVIKAEEESFLRTLDTGLDLFGVVAERVTQVGDSVIPGSDIFRLYDTYGFPYDLTEVLAAERGLSLDNLGFEKALNEQRDRSRATSDMGKKVVTSATEIVELLSTIEDSQTEFVRVTPSPSISIETESLGGSSFISADNEEAAAVILTRTPFYAESGGQVSDTGILKSGDSRFVVEDVTVDKGRIIHLGYVEKGHAGDFARGPVITATVDTTRRQDIQRNHTATHLAHAALRKVLGDHVRQSGSYVGPDRLRFDFSHHQPMTADEVAQVEQIVNDEILKGSKVVTDVMDVEAAKKSGAMALFGEKYSEKVRVVSINKFSKELCGGTHVNDVSQIGPFFVTLETGIASGVRRMEAITGREATKFMLAAKQFRTEAAQIVGRPEADALKGIEQLKQDNSELTKELKKTRAELVAGGGKSIGTETQIGSLHFWSHDFGESDRDSMGSWMDIHKGAATPTLAVGLGTIANKPVVMIAASGTAIKDHDLHAGNIAKKALSNFGGRGGGKPNFAQGGVAEGTAADKLFGSIEQLLKDRVGQTDA